MNIKTLLAVSLFLAPISVRAYELSPMAAPEPDSSSGTLTIDSWQPKGPVRREPPPPPPAPPAPVTAITPVPPAAATPPPAPSSALPPAPHPPKTAEVPKKSETVTPPPPAVYAPPVSMNEMKGTVTSIDPEPPVIRISIEGGFNPQLAYDAKTTVMGNGATLTMNDLAIGDQVVIRYIGKDLTAREIERIGKAAAAAPTPTVAPATTSTGTTPSARPKPHHPKRKAS